MGGGEALCLGTKFYYYPFFKDNLQFSVIYSRFLFVKSWFFFIKIHKKMMNFKYVTTELK